MIPQDARYFCFGAAFPSPNGLSTWHILDWDQRRAIGVSLEDPQQGGESAKALWHLRRHIDKLPADALAITVSSDSELLDVSTDPEDDPTRCVHYSPLSYLVPAGQAAKTVKTVLRSELVELDRLGPNVDLVRPSDPSDDSLLVFKYYFTVQFMFRNWIDMNICLRLPPHPHIVPFDSLVLDEVNGDVVGFTTRFIPDRDNTVSRLFRLVWLRQLLRAVDDLNLRYGIAHQDIAPRSLLVDPDTDALRLFDFNAAARIGDVNYSEARNDVKGVIFTLYEIITRDTHFRAAPYARQSPDVVQAMTTWAPHLDVQLDHGVAAYRAVLDEWVRGRRAGRQVAHYTQAAEPIVWPDIETARPSGGRGENEKPVWDQARPAVNPARLVAWERPAQSTMPPGQRVLASGKQTGLETATGRRATGRRAGRLQAASTAAVR